MYFSAERVGVGGMEVEEKEVCVCVRGDLGYLGDTAICQVHLLVEME